MDKKTNHKDSNEKKKLMPWKSARKAGSLLLLVVLLGCLSLAWAPKVLAASSESITLTASQNIQLWDGTVTLTAQVLDAGGMPVVNQEVTLTVLIGPYSGIVWSSPTDSNGQVSSIANNLFMGGETVGYQVSTVDGMTGKTLTSIVYVAWVYQGLTLTASPATQGLEAPVTLAAQVSTDTPAGQDVGFTVLSGPDAGKSLTGITDSNGVASVSFVSRAGVGIDTIQAITLDSASQIVTGPTIQVVWQDSSNITLSPPPHQAIFIGQSVSLTARALLGATDTPVVNQSVTFTVTAGPDAGKTKVSTTDSNGQAVLSFSDTTHPGTDIVQVSCLNPITGKTLTSNTVVVTWLAKIPKF